MLTEGMSCWEDSETGCICGNDCEPPKWMIRMWDKENAQKDNYIFPKEE